MNRNDLIKKLNKLVEKSEIYYEDTKLTGDPSEWHEEADELLLEYINDEEITETYRKIERWYS